MRAILFYLSLPLIYLISVLPFRFLYILSNFFAFILRNLLRYRRHIIIENLRKSFPEKSTEEINKITHAFYINLCDIFLETFKILTMSKAEMLKRCSFNDQALSLFEMLYNQNKNFIIVMGHFGNWEWGGSSYALLNKNKPLVIYHSLSNIHFNNLMYKIRSKNGSIPIKMQDTYKEMVNYKKILNATAFIADQTPQPHNAYWTEFLNQDTPVFLGTEKIAKKLNYPIVYASVNKIKRGYYQIHSEMLVENPKETKDGEITELHTKRLEQDIIKMPPYWLWSHRRWKHKRP